MNPHGDLVSFESVQADSQGKTLAEYAAICRQRIGVIVALAIGLAGVAGVWSIVQTPLYQSKATVVVDQAGPTGLEMERATFRADYSPEYFQTQFELMKSQLVFQRTAKLLHLSEQPEYKKRPFALSSMFAQMMPAPSQEFGSSKKGAPEMPTDEADDQLMKQFTQNVEIMPLRGARLAHITATSQDPKFAALVANTLASVYIDRTQELNALSKEKAAEWFTTHLDELRKKAEASQQKMYLFRVQHGLLGGREGRAATGQANTELDTELVRAEMRKAEAQSRLVQIESVLRKRTGNNKGATEIDWSSFDASTEVLSSPLIQTLRAQEIRASGQVAELTDKYGPLHPKLARAKAELEDLRNRIRQEVEKIVDSVRHEYNAALGRVRAIREAVGHHRQERIKLEQHDIEFGILEREAESSQHLYDLFLRQTKEANLSAGLRSDNVYLADPAVPSSIPAKPKTLLNTLLGLLVGLMTGVGLAFFLDARDRTIKGPDDVERYLPKISFLGVMPLLPKAGSVNTARLLTNRSQDATAESVRIIRTNVLLSNPSVLAPCVLVTSPGESEGKTTLAENLAVAMAQLENVQVILIDADLRKPFNFHIHGFQPKGVDPRGVADFLAGTAQFEEIIHRTNIANLSVIPRGTRPSNPSELLHSKQMSRLLSRCREAGFHILLDAPPVLPVTDAAILAALVDGVLLVASSGKTTRAACRLAIQRLRAAGGKILGIVLQKVRVPTNPYYTHVNENEGGVYPSTSASDR